MNLIERFLGYFLLVCSIFCSKTFIFFSHYFLPIYEWAFYGKKSYFISELVTNKIIKFQN